MDSDMIEVTGIDLRRLIKAVYAESVPQGMSFLHAQEGPMPDEMVERIVADCRMYPKGQRGCVLSLDYVMGRSVKFSVFQDEEEKLWVRKFWYDHSELKLRRALREAGLKENTDVDG